MGYPPQSRHNNWRPAKALRRDWRVGLALQRARPIKIPANVPLERYSEPIWFQVGTLSLTPKRKGIAGSLEDIVGSNNYQFSNAHRRDIFPLFY